VLLLITLLTRSSSATTTPGLLLVHAGSRERVGNCCWVPRSDSTMCLASPCCTAAGNSAGRGRGNSGGNGGQRGLLQNSASARYETARPGYGFNVITTGNDKIMIRGGAAQADFLAAPGSQVGAGYGLL